MPTDQAKRRWPSMQLENQATCDRCEWYTGRHCDTCPLATRLMTEEEYENEQSLRDMDETDNAMCNPAKWGVRN